MNRLKVGIRSAVTAGNLGPVAATPLHRKGTSGVANLWMSKIQVDNSGVNRLSTSH